MKEDKQSRIQQVYILKKSNKTERNVFNNRTTTQVNIANNLEVRG